MWPVHAWCFLRRASHRSRGRRLSYRGGLIRFRLSASIFLGAACCVARTGFAASETDLICRDPWWRYMLLGALLMRVWLFLFDKTGKSSWLIAATILTALAATILIVHATFLLVAGSWTPLPPL
jgi:hypothetical protein